MEVLRNLSWTRAPALFAAVAILSGALMSHAAMAQEAKAVENFPAILQRSITLWSDGTRLSGVLLYPKDRQDDVAQRFGLAWDRKATRWGVLLILLKVNTEINHEIFGPDFPSGS